MESRSHHAASGQEGTAMINSGSTRIAIACMGALVMAACGSARYPAYYMLNLEPSARAVAPGHGIGSLAIRELRCPDYLCEGRIVYRPTAEEIGFYQYHRWAARPDAMIAQYVTERVRARSLFTNVSGEDPHTTTNFVLSGALERLEEVDDARDVAAVCTIAVELVDTRTGLVVWSHTATERVTVQRRDVTGVVNSLSTAARASVDQLVTVMEFELGQARRNAVTAMRP